jgi:hypothetical protein
MFLALRFYNIRELLYLMGMPHDFELENPRRNINHLCQNVPVNTAADWAAEVIRFCRGEAQMTDFTFLRQNNTRQTITDSLPPQKKTVKQERRRRASKRPAAASSKLQPVSSSSSSPDSEPPGELEGELLAWEGLGGGKRGRIDELNRTFKCGLCNHEFAEQDDVRDHWECECPPEQDPLSAFACAGCGGAAAIWRHWQRECPVYRQDREGSRRWGSH